MALLDRWGVGRLARDRARRARPQRRGRRADGPHGACARCAADPAPRSILLVSKPPAPEVAREVAGGGAGDTPLVAALIGLSVGGGLEARTGVVVTGTLEAGCRRGAAPRSGRPAPDVAGGLRGRRSRRRRRDLPGDAHARPRPVLRRDALLRVARRPGRTSSARCTRTPRSTRTLRAARARRARTSASTSARRSTPKGRPHPMIDPEARIELLREAGADDPRSRRSCSTSCSATARTPTRPASWRPVCARDHRGRRARGRRLRPGHRAATRRASDGQRRGVRRGRLRRHRDRRRGRRWPPPRSPARARLAEIAAVTYRGRRACVTHSTKPRGGVVHTLALAEALHGRGRRRAPRRPRRPRRGLLPARPTCRTRCCRRPPTRGDAGRPGVRRRSTRSTDGPGGAAPAGSTCCTRRTASPPGPPRGSATPARRS